MPFRVPHCSLHRLCSSADTTRECCLRWGRNPGRRHIRNQRYSFPIPLRRPQHRRFPNRLVSACMFLWCTPYRRPARRASQRTLPPCTSGRRCRCHLQHTFPAPRIYRACSRNRRNNRRVSPRHSRRIGNSLIHCMRGRHCTPRQSYILDTRHPHTIRLIRMDSHSGHSARDQFEYRRTNRRKVENLLDTPVHQGSRRRMLMRAARESAWVRSLPLRPPARLSEVFVERVLCQVKLAMPCGLGAPSATVTPTERFAPPDLTSIRSLAMRRACDHANDRISMAVPDAIRSPSLDGDSWRGESRWTGSTGRGVMPVLGQENGAREADTGHASEVTSGRWALRRGARRRTGASDHV